MSDALRTPTAGNVGYVLVVEDDPQIRGLIELVLRDAGFATTEVGSAEAAQARIARGGIAAVVLDNRLPGMTGVELVRVLRSRVSTATLPVLLLTADDALADRVEGLEAGATDYLLKPFEPAELVARLDAHLRVQATWEERLETQTLSGAEEVERRRANLFAIVTGRAFMPVFQPVVALHGGSVVGYEALTRFSDRMSPQERFAEAANLGLGPHLELATVDSAVRAARELRSDRFLSLNVSADLIVNHGGELQDTIGGRDRDIVLELTEHEAVEDYPRLRTALALFDPPIELSVDDAGAGFASLRHVVMLEPAYVKLDRSWISGIDTDPTRQAMVAGLSHFSRQALCQLVAEGIESPAERDALEQLDVDLGQGYLLGMPTGI
jgi:EAL domain-containing protein (putative c-di-GMP-specific phosphodiesterase class I)